MQEYMGYCTGEMPYSMKFKGSSQFHVLEFIQNISYNPVPDKCNIFLKNKNKILFNFR